MRTSRGCKLFGAHQALCGIQDGVVLLHSVVGCQFGSLSYHLTCDMRDIRQTCTVISDSDIVFSGEASLKKAIRSVLELYEPKVLFVVSGCVSEMIGDDIPSVVREMACDTPIIYVEAAGFRGDVNNGYDAALRALLPLMQEPAPAGDRPIVNLLGLGGDDPHIRGDVPALRQLLEPHAELGCVLSHCTLEEVRHASDASLNLVLAGRGLALAKAMEERWGIPYVQLDYPYGLTGAKALYRVLEEKLSLDYTARYKALEAQVLEGSGRVYSYLQALYGVPAAILAEGSRARGMARFLEQELGMEILFCTPREEVEELEDWYEQVRRSETALLFGSSFEQDLADELEIPLIRFDFPVFDRLDLTDTPFAGGRGLLALLETILNASMRGRTMKGALYR